VATQANWTLNDLDDYVTEKVAGSGSAVRVESGTVLVSYQQKVTSTFTVNMPARDVDAMAIKYLDTVSDYKRGAAKAQNVTQTQPSPKPIDLYSTGHAGAIDFAKKMTASAAAADVKAIKSAGVAIATAISKASTLLQTTAANTTFNGQKFVKTFRGRTGTPFANDRGQDPPTYIEVVQLPKSPTDQSNPATLKSLGMKYNDFFITDTQEVDAEKAEVSETFGAPHVFASGRYMRKVMITGMCRTGAVNPDILNAQSFNTGLEESLKAKYAVPHTLGLRVLYDKVLRASEQISRNLFTRLIVDGEVYCGWFTTLNISRTGAEESFAHFTMSMLVFQRYHKDEDWAAKMLNTGSLPAKQAFPDASALATLESMAGKMSITLDHKFVSVKETVSEKTAGELTFSQPLSMKIDGVPQPVDVVVKYRGSSIPGIGLKYGTSSSSMSTLNGSSPGRGTHDVALFVHDFRAFTEALQSKAGNPAGKAMNAALEISITPSTGGNPASVTVDMIIDTKYTPKLAGFQLRLGSSQTDLGLVGSWPPKTVFQTPSTSAITLRFTITGPDGGAIDATALTGTRLTLVHPEKDTDLSASGPAISAANGTLGAVEKADIDAAALSGAAKVSVAPVLVALDPNGLCQITTTFDYSQLAAGVNLATSNPFASAKDLTTAFRFKLSIPGLNDCFTDKVSITAQYAKTWVSSLLQTLTSVEYGTPAGQQSPAYVSMTFTLNADAVAALKDKEQALIQAVEDIVARSSYDITGNVRAGIDLDTASFRTLLTKCKVSSRAGTSVTVSVPHSPTQLLSQMATKGGIVFTVTPPDGINPIGALICGKG